MSKVTSKLQVTVPKTVAEHFGIKPGDEIHWEIAGDAMRVVPKTKKRSAKQDDSSFCLRLFDQATRRQRQRETSFDSEMMRTRGQGRGWKRENLYTRGGAHRH